MRSPLARRRVVTNSSTMISAAASTNWPQAPRENDRNSRDQQEQQQSAGAHRLREAADSTR